MNQKNAIIALESPAESPSTEKFLQSLFLSIAKCPQEDLKKAKIKKTDFDEYLKRLLTPENPFGEEELKKIHSQHTSPDDISFKEFKKILTTGSSIIPTEIKEESQTEFFNKFLEEKNGVLPQETFDLFMAVSSRGNHEQLETWKSAHSFCTV
eukprot:c25782_g1_i1.p1 GENE.c25782_g1_i1~~c25782_g1_i1.p1  ORF type:complete len:153 (+),score=35.41 c25782_g1_i1:225-683(+)